MKERKKEKRKKEKGQQTEKEKRKERQKLQITYGSRHMYLPHITLTPHSPESLQATLAGQSQTINPGLNTNPSGQDFSNALPLEQLRELHNAMTSGMKGKYKDH